jgi:hypothetical protein
MSGKPSHNLPTSVAPVIIKETPPSWQKKGSRLPRDSANNGAHRGYWFIKKGNTYTYKSSLWRLFPAMPKQFVWHGDTGQAQLYIDAWYAGVRKETMRYEAEGLATNIDMPVSEGPAAREERTRIHAGRLLDTLGLVDSFDVPMWGKCAFITDGHYLVPVEFINHLVASNPQRFGHLDTKAKWVKATPKKLAEMGLRPEQVTSGMYRGQRPATTTPGLTIPTAPSMEAPAEDVAQEEAQAPPRERTIRRLDRVDYIEWVTEIIPDGGRPYYCRRLYRDRDMLYEATAWSPRGPWTVYHRDNTALLALGVDP